MITRISFYWSRLGLLSVAILGFLLASTTACNRDTVETNAKVDAVWALAQEFSSGSKTCDDLEAKFKDLNDAELKKLADKKNGELNFSLYVAKGKLTAKCIGIEDKFLGKIEAPNVEKQLSQKESGKTSFDVVRDTSRSTTSGESADDRDEMLAVYVAYKPSLVNDIKSSSGNFDPAPFNKVISKVKAAKLSDVANKVDAANLKTWIDWTLTDQTAGKPIFKKIHASADASKKTAMENDLWTAAQANYAYLKDLVADMLPGGSNDWGVNTILTSKLDDIVEKQLANVASSGKADFKALYAAVSAAEKPTVRAKLWAETAKAGTAAAVTSVIGDITAMPADALGLNATAAASIKDLLETVVAQQYTDLAIAGAAGGKARFIALYTAGAPIGNPEKQIMREALYKAAHTAGAAATTTLFSDVAGGGPDTWGLAAVANVTKELLDTVVAADYAAFATTGKAAFKALYIAGAPITGVEQTIMRAKLWAEALAAGTAVAVTNLVTDIDTMPADALGLNGAAAANKKELLDTVVAAHYAAFATTGKASFKALYVVAGAEQATMRAKLWAEALAAATAVAVTNLVTDIDTMPADALGLNGNAVANKKELLDTVVAAHYAAFATTGKVAFKALYAVAGAAEQGTMRAKLWEEAEMASAAAGNATAITDLITDIDTMPADALGLNGAAAANKKELLEDFVNNMYLAFLGGAPNIGGLGGAFNTFYLALAADPANQATVRNALVAIAYDTGRKAAGHTGLAGSLFDRADYNAAVAKVGDLVTNNFFTASEVVGNIFDPAWVGGGAVGADSRLLWSVLQKAALDVDAIAGLAPNSPDKFLSATMVASIAAPLKALFTAAPGNTIDPSDGIGGNTGAINWMGYLDAANNEGGPNKSIEENLVRAKIAAARAALALPAGPPTDEALAKDATWLDY